MDRQLHIVCHAAVIKCVSDSPLVLEHLEFDFAAYAYRHSDLPPTHEIEVRIESAKIDSTGWVRIFRSTNYTWWFRGPKRRVQYSDGSLITYNHSENSALVQSLDPNWAALRTYFLLCSMIGEHEEKRGWYRFHAMALARDGEGYMFVGPKSGGKSTLAAACLGENGIQLISDDTPFINRKLKLKDNLARFSLKGLEPPRWSSPPAVRQGFSSDGTSRTYTRIDRSSKLATRGIVPLRQVYILKKSRAAKVSASSSLTTLRALALNLIVGWGIPQLAEFYLRFGPRDIFRLLKALTGRTLVSFALIRQVHFYDFFLDPKGEVNSGALLIHLQGSNQESR